jgi:hypothetical protein
MIGDNHGHSHSSQPVNVAPVVLAFVGNKFLQSAALPIRELWGLLTQTPTADQAEVRRQIQGLAQQRSRHGSQKAMNFSEPLD